MYMKNIPYLKSQGEIFGVMLFFVILILGFYLYSEFRAVYSIEEQDSILQSETEILVESVMQHLKTVEIECFRNRRLSGVDLLNFCVDNTGLTESQYTISCTHPPNDVEVCQTFLNSFNHSLHQLFSGVGNQDPIHGLRPFSFRIIPSNDIRYPHLNKSFDNLEQFDLSLNASDPNYYLRQRFSRISSDFQNIPTNQGRFEFELFFYHRR